MSDILKNKGDAAEVTLASASSSVLEKPTADEHGRKKSWSLFRRKLSVGDEKDAKQKEKRPSISDSGPFVIEMRNGVPIAVENKNWPPGVDYKESSLKKQLRSVDDGLGDFYANQGPMIPGGEGLANVGPDPDWIPGLTEEQRKKLRSDKSGRYVF